MQCPTRCSAHYNQGVNRLYDDVQILGDGTCDGLVLVCSFRGAGAAVQCYLTSLTRTLTLTLTLTLSLTLTLTLTLTLALALTLTLTPVQPLSLTLTLTLTLTNPRL